MIMETQAAASPPLGWLGAGFAIGLVCGWFGGRAFPPAVSDAPPATPAATAPAPAVPPIAPPVAPSPEPAAPEFGREPAAPAASDTPVAPPPAVPPAPPTTLDLHLVGTVTGTDSESVALIRIGASDRQNGYGIGDAVLGATVEAIGSDRVVLRRDGRLETLRIAPLRLRPRAAAPEPAAPPAPAD